MLTIDPSVTWPRHTSMVPGVRPDRHGVLRHDGPPVIETMPGTTVGTHGYPSNHRDMDAIFIAWGYGIHKASRLDTSAFAILASAEA